MFSNILYILKLLYKNNKISAKLHKRANAYLTAKMVLFDKDNSELLNTIVFSNV